MDIAKRIHLIREIAKHLANEDNFRIINLILAQYGFEVANNFYDTLENYIIDRIQDATDADLIKMGRYYGIDIHQLKEIVVESAFWSPNSFKLFISHCSSVKDKAQRLKKALNPYYISSFVAHQDITASKHWRDELRTALNTMDLLVAIVSVDFKESNWTDQEVGWALGRGVNIIPLEVDTNLYGFLEERQSIKAKGYQPEEIAGRIFSIITDIAPARDIMLATLMENSYLANEKNRIDEINKILDLLLHFNKLKPDEIEEIGRQLHPTIITKTEVYTKFGSLCDKHNYYPRDIFTLPTDVNDIPF